MYNLVQTYVQTLFSLLQTI